MFLTTAKVISRGFEKIKKEDWKIETEINEQNSKRIDCNIVLSNKQKEFLEFGFMPLSMDDKWFFYMEDDVFHGIRSWSGKEMFRCFVQKQARDWKIYQMDISEEWNETLLMQQGTITSLINYRLKTMERMGF